MTNTTELIKTGQKFMSELQFPAAEQNFQRALQNDPACSDAMVWLGKIAFIRDQNDEALKLFDLALSVQPKFAEAVAMKGLYYMKLENFDRAIEFLEQAKSINPGLEMIYFNLGKSYREIGQFEKAEAALRKAIEMDPNQYQAYSQLSHVLVKTGRGKEGIQAMVKALRINPLYLKGYLILGTLYKNADKGDLVIRLYRAGIKHNPNAIPLREELCVLYSLKLDFRRAYVEALEIVTRRREYGDYLRWGNLAVAMGKIEEAEKAYKAAIEMNPQRWEGHYDLAELYMSANLMDKAREHYQAAVKNNKENFKPFNGLGYFVLMVDHNWSEAVKNFRKALEVAPKQPEPRLNMAIASAKKKEFVAAERYAKEVQKLVNPDSDIFKQAEKLIKAIAKEKRK